jgi:hypothetical protein
MTASSWTCLRGGKLVLVRGHLRTLAQASGLRLELDYWITDADDAADQDVGVDSRAVGERLDDPGPRHFLEMPTRLAEFDAEAFDLADAEVFANEAVDIDVAHGHLPSSLTRLESDLFHNIGCNERKRLA